jgi:enolase
MKITSLKGREIFDSRGMPTVACDIILDHSYKVSASVPSGKSTGVFEAHELRDGGDRLYGKGVTQAVENIDNIIAPMFIGKKPSAISMDLKMIDKDGTKNKSHLGSNALLAVSMAMYRAQSFDEGIELFELIAHVMSHDTVTLPFPMFNIINGGAHADNDLSIQEFMVVPVGLSTFRSALEAGFIIYQELKSYLQERNIPTPVADEGGFAIGFNNTTDTLDILMHVINKVSEKCGISSVIALDVAANSFYDEDADIYTLDGKKYTSIDLINYYGELCNTYPIYSIEDGLHEKDTQGWIDMTEILSDNVRIVGDDLFVTNMERISEGAEQSQAHASIIKPNQIGTITETLQAIKLCKEAGLSTIVSHRSGDTCDSFIADLAVGAHAGHIKSGGLARSERLSKYNRLLDIEDYLSLTLIDA